MKRLLLVAGDAERAGLLSKALVQEGFDVEVAPEGWYALTMLERQPAALVLVDGVEGAPSARELAAIVRSDDDLRGVKLALAAGPAEALPAGFDLTLEGGLCPAQVAAEMRRFALDRRVPDTLVLSGALDALDLLHLTGTLGQCRRTGRLSLLFPGDGVGEVYFDQGRVVHTRWGAREGRAAFSALFAGARLRAEVSFEFEMLTREEVFRYPRTVTGEVQDLLLSMEPEPDESRAAGGHDGQSRR